MCCMCIIKASLIIILYINEICWSLVICYFYDTYNTFSKVWHKRLKWSSSIYKFTEYFHVKDICFVLHVIIYMYCSQVLGQQLCVRTKSQVFCFVQCCNFCNHFIHAHYFSHFNEWKRPDLINHSNTIYWINIRTSLLGRTILFIYLMKFNQCI